MVVLVVEMAAVTAVTAVFLAVTVRPATVVASAVALEGIKEMAVTVVLPIPAVQVLHQEVAVVAARAAAAAAVMTLNRVEVRFMVTPVVELVYTGKVLLVLEVAVVEAPPKVAQRA